MRRTQTIYLTSCSTESLGHLFSIMHLNIQSIVPKLYLVETESLAYDIMFFFGKLAETDRTKRLRNDWQFPQTFQVW